MEEFDEFKCPKCKENFNADNKIPRLLYNCGHTICQSCINLMLTELKANQDNPGALRFKCPEDEEIYEGITKAEAFPKNIALIKLITKAEEVKQSKLTVNNQSNTPKLLTLNNPELYKNPFISSKSPRNPKNSTAATTFNQENPVIQIISNENTLNSNTSNNNHMFNNIRSSLKRTHTLNTQEKEHLLIDTNLESFPTSPFNATPKNKFCSVHPNRPLEVICIDHKIKLCTNCALFGEHKNHKIVNEEDFMKEIEVKAEILIELFEMVDNNINSFKSEETGSMTQQLEEMLIKNEEKKVYLTKQIQTFTEELIQNIKIREGKLIEEVHGKFGKIQSKIVSLREIPPELAIKSEEWKVRVQSKLDILNEITESSNLNDEFVKLIDMNITDQEMIANAENIINEYEKIKHFPLDSIDKMIESNNIDINYESANTLVSTAMIFINSEPDLDSDEILILDEDDKKRLERLGDHLEEENNLNCFDGYNNTNTPPTGSNTDNYTIKSSSKLNTRNASEANLNINVSAVNPNTNQTNTNNNSFLNLSEDSAIIRLNNYNTIADKKGTQSSNGKLNSSGSSGIININPGTSLANSKSLKNINNSTNNSPKTVSRKAKEVINLGTTAHPNTTHNTPSNFSNNNPNNVRHVNVIKLPNKKDTVSKSPLRDSNQYDKDKIVFIKSQFKNECANFTGNDIGEEGAKIISELLLGSNKLTTKVKELKLTKTNLTDESLIPIVKALETNQTVATLNLSKNYLTDKSTESIVNLLSKNKNLKSITLSGNNFSTGVKDKIKSYGGGGKMIKIFI